MPSALEIIMVVVAVLLWFIWKQLEMIAKFIRALYVEAVNRRTTQGSN
jgi:hypothetical protein